MYDPLGINQSQSKYDPLGLGKVKYDPLKLDGGYDPLGINAPSGGEMKRGAGTLEAAGALGSGLVSWIPAGLSMVTPITISEEGVKLRSPNEMSKTAMDIQESLTYEPKTKEGTQVYETVTMPLRKVSETFVEGAEYSKKKADEARSAGDEQAARNWEKLIGVAEFGKDAWMFALPVAFKGLKGGAKGLGKLGDIVSEKVKAKLADKVKVTEPVEVNPYIKEKTWGELNPIKEGTGIGSFEDYSKFEIAKKPTNIISDDISTIPQLAKEGLREVVSTREISGGEVYVLNLLDKEGNNVGGISRFTNKTTGESVIREAYLPKEYRGSNIPETVLNKPEFKDIPISPASTDAAMQAYNKVTKGKESLTIKQNEPQPTDVPDSIFNIKQPTTFQEWAASEGWKPADTVQEFMNLNKERLQAEGKTPDMLTSEWEKVKDRLASEQGAVGLDINKPIEEIVKEHNQNPDKQKASKNIAKEFEKRVVTSVGKVISRETPAGREMVNLIQETYGAGERLGGEWVANYKTNTINLSKVEKANLVDVLEGTKEPINAKVETAAKIERENLNAPVKMLMEMPEGERLTVSHPSVRKWQVVGEKGKPFKKDTGYWELLDENGVKVASSTKKVDMERVLRSFQQTPFNPRENYFPRMIKREVLEKRIDDAVNHLIETGQVAKVDALTKERYSIETQREIARSKINIFMRRNSERRYGNLQIARELDLPEWAYERNPDVVLPTYYEKTGMRIAEAKAWGAKDQRLFEARDKIIEQGGDSEFTTRALDRILHKEPFDSGADAIVKGLTGYQVVTKMGLSQIAQITQRLSSLYRGNMSSFLKGQRDAFKNSAESQDYFIRAGGGLKSVSAQARIELTGSKSGAAEKFLKYTGFTRQDIQSRYVATLTGKYYAEYLVDTLKKNPKSPFANRRLEQLNLNPKEISERGFKLTQEESYKAGQKFEIDTNFRNRSIDLPEFWTSRWGRVVTQFKSFTYSQTRMLRDHVVKEAMKGNVMPLVYLLTIGQVSGEVINDVRGFITGRKQSPNVLKRMLENYAVVGGIGLFDTFFSTLRYGDTQLGATQTTLVKGVSAANQAVKGNLRPGAIFLVGETPVVGQRLKRELTERTESKAAKKKKKTEEEYWKRNPYSPRAIIPGKPPKKEKSKRIY